MNRSAPISLRTAASAGPGWLTPTQQFWWKYSVADRGRMCSVVYASSPIAPVVADLAIMPSSCASIGGIHAQPISVITNFRRGKRSNTPESSELDERPLRVEATSR